MYMDSQRKRERALQICPSVSLSPVLSDPRLPSVELFAGMQSAREDERSKFEIMSNAGKSSMTDDKEASLIFSVSDSNALRVVFFPGCSCCEYGID